MFHCLLYISDHWLPPAALLTEVKAIVAGSLQRNRALHVTGALVATADHFAQMLEGPHAHVEQLMAHIAQDPRHGNVRIIDFHARGERFFPRWSLAHLGTSDEFERRIEVLERAHRGGANMIAAALEFAHCAREAAWRQGRWREG